MLDKVDHTARLLAERERHVPRGIITAHPVVIERAQGAEVWDVNGRRYLDFVGGIGVLNVGHNHPRVVHAVRAQLERVSHVSFQVAGYPPYIELAARLNALVGDRRVIQEHLPDLRAEAVENAVKIARAYTNRPAVIAFRGGFHGRTLLGVSLTGFASPYKQNFGPFAPDIHHAPYPNPYRGCTVEAALAALQELFAIQVAPDRVAAFLIEPVQGDGGFSARPARLPTGAAADRASPRHRADHRRDPNRIRPHRQPVRVPAGRHPAGPADHGQEPGRRPAALRRGRAGGDHGRAAAGGLGGNQAATDWPAPPHWPGLDAFEQDGLLERSRELGEALASGLRALAAKYPAIGEVRGLGFMQAIEMVAADGSPDAALAGRVIDAARDGGLLVIKCGVYRNVVRFLAPLVTTDAQLAEPWASLTMP